MKIKTFFSQLFKYFDLFSTMQFLRYKQEQDYKTASGGIVSLLVVSIFLALFFNTAIQTINRSIINWTSNSIFSNEPLPTNLTFSNSSFMFTVGVMGINLNDPNLRYFDIKMTSYRNGMGGANIQNQTIGLVPCSKQHFGISQQLSDDFDNMMTKYWLCPPLNYTYEIQGKFISKQMKYVQVSINKCDPATDPTRPCISQAVIDSMILNYGPFMVSFFYINPMINAGESDYLSYYLEAKNFLSFTKSLGAYGIGFVQEYQIYTDQSLLPFTENNLQKGVRVPDLFQTVPFQVTGTHYASFNLMKSSLQTTFSRSFNKIDQFFSYVGGLVGTILGLMLFMGNFTSMAYALDLAHRLFKYKDDDSANFKDFSLLSYLSYTPYKIAKFFNFCKGWKVMKKREQCLEQVQKQLDISLILRKLNFLQKSLQMILGQQQYNLHHHQKEEVLSEVKKRRRLYARRKKTTQNHQNLQEQSCSDEQSEDEEDQSSKDDNKVFNNHNEVIKIEELRINNKTDQSFINNQDMIHNYQDTKSSNKQQNSLTLLRNSKKLKFSKGEKNGQQNSSKFKIGFIENENSILKFQQDQRQIPQAHKNIKNGFDFEKLED